MNTTTTRWEVLDVIECRIGDDDELGSFDYMLHITPNGTQVFKDPDLDLDVPMLLRQGWRPITATQEGSIRYWYFVREYDAARGVVGNDAACDVVGNDADPRTQDPPIRSLSVLPWRLGPPDQAGWWWWWVDDGMYPTVMEVREIKPGVFAPQHVQGTYGAPWPANWLPSWRCCPVTTSTTTVSPTGDRRG